MRVPTHAVILPVALAAMLVGVVPGAAKDKLQQKNERKQAAADMLDKLPESNSLRWNASQLQTWARYEGDDVLPRLLQIYEKPPAPFENNMRYLAAAAFRNRHDIPNATPDDVDDCQTPYFSRQAYSQVAVRPQRNAQPCPRSKSTSGASK